MTEEEKLRKFLLLTDKIAARSKDPSTKVGAIFLNKMENAPRSFGYNGMPRGLDDTNEERNIRPEKYQWYEHAERNAIYNVAREILTDKIIFLTKYPNMEEARAIVSVGISKVIVPLYSHEEKSSDPKMVERVTTLFKEMAVELIELNELEIRSGFSPYDYGTDLTEAQIKEELKEFSIKEKYLNNIDILQEYANYFSPDRVSKHGAMILDKTFTPVENGFGVNSPPDILKEITEEMHEEKEFWFQEPVKNAIFNSVREKFDGCTGVASWCPCIHCSLAITSVGTKKVVTRAIDLNNEADKRWEDSFNRSKKLYKMAGIEFVLLNEPKLDNTVEQTKKVKSKKV